MINGIDVSDMKTGAVIASNSCFELYLKRGIGIHSTPYTEFDIHSIGDADKFGIIISATHFHNEYNGEPVENNIEELHINVSANILRNEADMIACGVTILKAEAFIEECNRILHLGGTNDNT